MLELRWEQMPPGSLYSLFHRFDRSIAIPKVFPYRSVLPAGRGGATNTIYSNRPTLWSHTKLGGDSSGRSSGCNNRVHGGMEVAEEVAGVANFQLMYMALEGSAACADRNFRGIDCMKMHIPACEEHALVVQLLLKRGAARWPSWFFCR
jgi:hypothetical protein